VGSTEPTANQVKKGGCSSNPESAYASVLKKKSGAYTFRIIRTSDKKVEAEGTVTLDFSASTQTSSQSSSG